MSSKGIAFLAFIAGAGMGSVCTWQLLKRKYELIAQEDKVAEDRTQKDEGDVDFKKYASIIQKEGYTDYSRSVEEKKGEAFVEKPYVISPEEFGEFEEYEKISLTYYADKVLADENDEEVDDVDEIVGEESLNHFGEYEDDSVFVRNDRLKCDYEILLDQRNYSDVAKTRPHRVEE